MNQWIPVQRFRVVKIIALQYTLILTSCFMHRKSRFKIYYSAGIFSLVLLPLISFWQFSWRHPFEKEHVISVVCRPKAGFYGGESFLHKKYTTFQLTADPAANQNTIREARLKMRKMVRSGDTTSGVHFHLSDLAPFQALIHVLDACKREDAKVYIPDGNEVWVCNPDPPKPVNREFSTFMLICGYVQATDPEAAWEKQMRYIAETTKVHWVSVVCVDGVFGVEKKYVLQEIILSKSRGIKKCFTSIILI